MAEALIGGLFVIAGVLVSLLGQVTYDAWKNRKRFTFRLESASVALAQTNTYFRIPQLGETEHVLASGTINEMGWVYTTPSEHGAFVVMSFVLNLQNRSQLDDALVSVTASASTVKGCAKSTEPYAAGSRFYGAPIPSHGYRALGLAFAIPAREVIDDALPSSSTELSIRVQLTTIRGQTFTSCVNQVARSENREATIPLLPQPELPPYFSPPSDAADDQSSASGI